MQKLGIQIAQSAYTGERLQVNNKRNFLQANLDSEMNVSFLLNEHGNLYFYRIITAYILSSLAKKIKKNYRTEKKILLKACKIPLLWNANYDRENDYLNTLCPHRFKWCDISTNVM